MRLKPHISYDYDLIELCPWHDQVRKLIWKNNCGIGGYNYYEINTSLARPNDQAFSQTCRGHFNSPK